MLDEIVSDTQWNVNDLQHCSVLIFCVKFNLSVKLCFISEVLNNVDYSEEIFLL